MPRQQAKKTYFTFVGGLNTEAGYLTFPPNVWKEGDNVIPQVDGSLHLRTAVNFENGHVLSTTEDTTTEKQELAYGCFEWNNVQGDGGKNYIVVQRGQFLYFYVNINEETSTRELDAGFIIDLDDFKSASYPHTIGTHLIQCVSANGTLIVTSIATDPFIVEEITDATEFTVTRLTLKMRDFEGDITDPNLGSEVDTQPVVMPNSHKYNLLNQGWREEHITAYQADQGVYPSNAQQWFAGKNSLDDFEPALLAKQEFGKGRAPQGHFILDVFDRDRETVSGVDGFVAEIEDFRPAACEFFAGRAFYAGTPLSKKIGGWVFFSQVGLSTEKYANCYQDADPTSEQSPDLIESDGGVIPIYGAGQIHRLVAIDRALLVFADNGVWSIAGTIESGFSATRFEVKQVLAVGILGPQTVVRLENQVIFWAREGIWTIGAGQGGGFEAKNITNETIATLFNAIDPIAKSNAIGKYHVEDKKVYWLYNSAPVDDGVTDRFLKDRILVLDSRIGCFYTHSIGVLESNSPYVLDAIPTKGRGLALITNLVISEALDQVVDEDDNLVGTIQEASIGLLSTFKFMTLVPVSSNFSITWSEFEDGLDADAKFFDWFDHDDAGVGYSGFIVTGYDLGAGQGGDRKLQTNYATILMKRTETGIDAGGDAINESSVRISIRWNFADGTVSNKWSTPMEVYRHRRVFIPVSLPSATFEDGFPVVIAKHKLRGRGNAFQLRYESTPGKDLQLIGWSIVVLSNVD